MKRRRRRKPKTASKPAEAPLQPVYDLDEPPVETIPQEREEATGAEAEAPAQRSERPVRGRRRRQKKGGRKEAPVAQAAPAIEEPAAEEEAQAGETFLAEEPANAQIAQAQPQQQHVAHGKRPHRGTVVLAIGLPGSGKTSWFRRRGITPLSSDLLRMVLFDDITEQRYQDLVFSTLRYLLRARMIARMPWNYVDATNLSPRERRGWIKMSQEFGYDVQAVFFDVPAEVCAERNRRRGRIVPDEIMNRFVQKLRPPTFEEGFSKVTVVRVKRHAEEEAGMPSMEAEAQVDEADDSGE